MSYLLDIINSLVKVKGNYLQINERDFGDGT